jgi:uncharacterized membrane protein
MSQYKPALRFILAIFMIAIGIKHFTDPEPFVSIVPPFLTHSLILVYASGFFEVLGGLGLLIPRLQHSAAWLLVILFITVFPANLYQAINNIPVSGLPHDPPLIWLRFPMQFFLVGWAWWFTRHDDTPMLTKSPINLIEKHPSGDR